MADKPVILIAEDEKNTREGLARALRRRYQILLAENGIRAMEILEQQHVDVLLSDIRMPGMDGLTLLQRALARTPQPVCILLTAYGTIETAVEAMRRGAYDFLTKPINLDRLEILVDRAISSRTLEQENKQLKTRLNSQYGMENIIGRSAPMHEVLETVRQVADSRATVLIEGESGTGKELVAKAIHQLSPRSRGPLVAVHCAALSANLLESELFGHEKGAFTGAQERRQGRFELADGGTLFLDEIGEIDLNTQVKILRVLEEQTFERVGGGQPIQVDVRLVTATNKDLRKLVAEGKFREDLFYRLYVVAIHLPPLRERTEDIPILANHFLQEVARQNNRPVPTITADALEVLTRYSWPGNVRELRNVVERMVVLNRSDKLTCRDIPERVRESGQQPGPGDSGPELSIDAAEKKLIFQALENCGNNRTKAAAQLGISRRTLHRKLAEYGVHSI